MELSKKFVCASYEACTYEKHVNAPYFRKSFNMDGVCDSAELTICGLGFYELYVNGKNITKGALAPYISNPDDICYYDSYDVKNYLREGENVIGIMLGNGFFNPFGGTPWDFEKAPWIGAPRFALNFCAKSGDNVTEFDARSGFVSHNSPITFDEYRDGVHYDARLETDGWCEPGYDDSDWKNALWAEAPGGEAKLCTADAIVVCKEMKPVSIEKQDGGYLYDFGYNCAGVCRLSVSGTCGQKIILSHGEILKDGKFYMGNLTCCVDLSMYDKYGHKDVYICKGAENEIFVPSFTYHGFRYVFVEGVTEEQATENLLTYLVMNSDLKERSNFECSDEMANLLQQCVRRSDLANFYYFPTDCPHREKNGWTGDASMSSEHMMLNLKAENSFAEWMCNIRKAQREDGAVPGIVPTAGWGFEREGDFGWNGPAWDSVISNVPYYVYKYTGNKQILRDNAQLIFSYLGYITTRINERGLICFGLGDWCQPKRRGDSFKTENDPKTFSSPIEFTDSAIILDMCKKAAFMFDEIGMELQRDYALALHKKLLGAIREHMIDSKNSLAVGNCQTSQALALEFNIFTEEEKSKAYENLVKIIHEDGDFLNVGMIGARYIFHVLAKGGDADLAYKMITRTEQPSYGYQIMHGATALWEDFTGTGSCNHHFFGDISAWFIRYVAGIKPNPSLHDVNEAEISPCFIGTLNYAKAHYDAPAGRFDVCWKRREGKIILDVTVPEKGKAKIKLGCGYAFENGETECGAVSGSYVVVKK